MEDNAIPLTFGQKAVGLSLHSSDDQSVQDIKKMFAGIIDYLNNERNAPPREGVTDPGERNRMLSVAITDAQTAQMWAVKAVTWRG